MEKLKKNKIMQFLFEKFRITLSVISPTLCSKVLYWMIFHKRLNLKEPKKFNEKLMWLKLNTYNKNDLITKCVDKYLVREYIKEKNCSEILNELLFVYDNEKEIIWDELPQKFALKCNHGCGSNIICSNKNNLDEQKVKEQLKKWMNTDFWKLDGEVNYKYINKKIICEKFIENEKDKNALPIDYKIYCFNGKPKMILVCSERKEKVKYNYYDTNWNVLEISKEISDRTIEKPKVLNEMLKYAETLAEDFPFVRVDFYEMNNKIIFGELTFTPSGCLDNDFSEEGDLYLGSLLDITKEMQDK